MPQKRLIQALWAVIAALAVAFFLTKGDDGYREYVTPGFVATELPPASPQPAAVIVTEAARPSSASTVPAPASAVSLGGVAALMDGGLRAPVPVAASKPSASPSATPPSPAATAPTDTSAAITEDADGPMKTWRPASVVSAAEIEAAIQRDAMTPETAAGFRSACNHDHSLYFDSQGRPLYSCAMKIQVGPDTTSVTSTPSFPLDQTFKLHSRRAASRKIYLDFDGHITRGTPWNAGRSASLVTPAFSRDADPAFNDAEKAIVQEVFRRVAEHFAPWAVDVTTEDPGVEALRKTSASDVLYGIRVVIGPKAFSTGAAGLAYVNSFSNSIDNPCFTFTDGGLDTAPIIAGITSHEVGHTVSLLHQGVTPIDNSYYGGHGSGALSWSPIMGNGLRPVNQWAKGEYQNANEKQDNIVAIANTNSGIPPVPDDHGGTMATATVAPGTSLTAGGVISNAADLDLIKIAAGRGDLTITPKVALYGPNLRLQIKVLNASGVAIATYEGSGTEGNMAPAPITIPLSVEGFYYIQMDGIGNGTGVTEGYTDYGSIGTYSLVAAWPEQGNKKPIADASLTTPTTYDYAAQPGVSVDFNGVLSYDPDGLIFGYHWNFNDVYPVSATEATAVHRYKAPGVYRPTLTVVDDLGATGTTTLTITVTGPTLPARCSLAGVSGSFVRVNSVSDAATASVRVQDQYGNPLRRAVVNATISGMVKSATLSVRTDDSGQAQFVSPSFRRGTGGSVRFNVNSIQSTTHPYVPADNDVPTLFTLSRP